MVKQGNFDEIVIQELKILQGDKTDQVFSAEIGVAQGYLSNLYHGKTTSAWLVRTCILEQFLPHLIQVLRERRAEYRYTLPAAPDP